jgi:hypothetical protein
VGGGATGAAGPLGCGETGQDAKREEREERLEEENAQQDLRVWLGTVEGEEKGESTFGAGATQKVKQRSKDVLPSSRRCRFATSSSHRGAFRPGSGRALSEPAEERKARERV